MLSEVSTPEEFQALIQNGAIAIDVRTQGEYTESKIPEAVTGYDWNSGEFHDQYDQLDPTKAYVFICRSGNRSLQACLYLQSQGFEHVYNLRGGMMGWQGETV